MEEKGICFSACGKGYSLNGGQCIENCASAAAERGQFCLLSGVLVPRKSYFAETVAYQSTTICREGYYKSSGMCYRDCKLLGMVNCGTGICTDKAETCTNDLKNLVSQVTEKLHLALEAIANCQTATADIAAIKAKILSELSGITIEQLKKIFIKNYAEPKRSEKQIIFDNAVSKLKKYCANSLNPLSKLSFLSSFCSTVYDYLLCKFNPVAPINKSPLVNSLDVMYLSKKTSKCKETCNGGITCADNIFSNLKPYDATGILFLGHGLFYETCQFCVDCEPDPKSFYPPIVSNIIKPGCVYLYENTEFTGNVREFCTDVPSIASFNARSMITGKDIHVVVWHSVLYKNGFFGVGKGQYVASLHDGNHDTYGLKFVNVNSIKILKNDCLHIIDAKRNDPSFLPTGHVITSVCKGDNQTNLTITLNTLNNFYFFKSFSLTQKFRIYNKSNPSQTYIVNGQTFLTNLVTIGFNIIGKIDFL